MMDIWILMHALLNYEPYLKQNNKNYEIYGIL